ncbi:MAG: dimethylargininase [bacterium]|nr:dimethylargininase [bacterium]
MLFAITREVSPRINACEVSHVGREVIDVGRAARQHGAYCACLERLGCEVVRLPAEADWPDSVFVEDAAVVVDELAVITRPGAASRRAETASIEAALRPYRPIRHLREPATLDGGDVLVVGRTIFVGLSARTNRAGLEQLGDLLGPHGYEVQGLPVTGCLHLKSACTCVGGNTLLINRNLLDAEAVATAFAGLDLIDVPTNEPAAANALPVGSTVLLPAGHPQTRTQLEARGFTVETVDLSELAKAEGALTCSSLVFEAGA